MPFRVIHCRALLADTLQGRFDITTLDYHLGNVFTARCDINPSSKISSIFSPFENVKF